MSQVQVRTSRRRTSGGKIVTIRGYTRNQLRTARRTSTHAKLGLHRQGRKGNRYTDKAGNVFHRVGKGKKSGFTPGVSPKEAKAAVHAKRKARKSLRAATAKKFIKSPIKNPAKAKTSSHAKAGLHRVGKSGNRYSDTKGNVFHRIGKGKKSRFVKGEPKSKAQHQRSRAKKRGRGRKRGRKR